MEPSSANAKRSTGNLYRQANVIIIILCLSFCSKATQTAEWEQLPLFTFYSTLIAVPGLLLLIVLTEFKGRRPLLISLFLLFILSLYERFLLPMVQAATTILTPVVICEYTDSKLRMVILIVNIAVLRISSWLAGYIWQMDLFNFGLAIGCIFSITTWPESPYWLASKGRFEESKQEFLSLRSEGSRSKDELQALIEETPRQGSLKMFYAPLLMAFPVLFTSSYLSFFEQIILGIDQDKFAYAVIVNVICAFVTTIISLKLSRRIYFLSSTAILFTFLILVWVSYFFDSNDYVQVRIVFNLVSYVTIVCGPMGVSIPILIEIIPQKYVSIMSAFVGCVYCFVNFFIDMITGLFDDVPILCLSASLSFVSAYFFLSEAKDKTLLEIERSYLPKTKKSESPVKTEL